MMRVEKDSKFWQARSVLVTGATGLLGGWLVRALIGAGARIVALIRDGSADCMLIRDKWVNQISTVRGDLLDLPLLRRTMAKHSVDTVFHLAAQANVGVAKIDPVGTLETNIRGTWNILDAARVTDVKQIVVASSDKAYGACSQLPYREDQPLRGTFPYDVSKSCADLLCGMYARTYELPVAVARCANLFGGGDLNFSRAIPGVITSTLKSEPFLIRSDGKFVRDFLYVQDAALAYMHLAGALASDRSLIGEAFNFGLGTPRTVLEVVHMVLKMMRRTDLEPVIQNIATSEIREQYLAVDKASRILGWRPAYAMPEALEETISWYRSYFAATGLGKAAERTASAVA